MNDIIKPPSNHAELFDKQRTIAILEQNGIVSVDEQAAEKIYKLGKKITSKAGKVIIRQSNKDDDAYFILSGEVSVFVNGDEKEPRLSSDLIGELSAFIPGTERTATLVAKTDVVLLKLTGKQIVRLVRENPAMTEMMYRSVADLLVQRLKDQAPNAKSSSDWLNFSMLISTAVFLAILCILIVFFRVSLPYSFLIAFASAIGTLMLAILNNPTLIYVRMFALTVTSAVSYATFGFFIRIGAIEIEVANNDFDWITLSLLTILAAVCGLLDLKTRFNWSSKGN